MKDNKMEMDVGYMRNKHKISVGKSGRKSVL
jgi:hypothetical protein